MRDVIEEMPVYRPITMIESKKKMTMKQIYLTRAETCRSFGLIDRAVIYDTLARGEKDEA
jgi:hypothetical protein